MCPSSQLVSGDLGKRNHGAEQATIEQGEIDITDRLRWLVKMLYRSPLQTASACDEGKHRPKSPRWIVLKSYGK